MKYLWFALAPNHNELILNFQAISINFAGANIYFFQPGFVEVIFCFVFCYMIQQHKKIRYIKA